MRPLPPSQPLIDISDDPDPAAESAQRVAAVAQAAQSALSTWAIYGQRAGRRGLAQDGQDRGDDRGDLHTRDDRGDWQARARLGEANEELWRMASEPARSRPLIPDDAGLDAIGPGSTLTAEQQLEVLHRYKMIPAVDPDVIDERVAQVIGKPSTTIGVGDARDAGSEAAKDEATEAGAMWAGNDDNLATVSYIGGTNRGAGRSPRVRDAMGDANEQAAEEALRRQGDPLGGDPVSGDPVSGDPVAGDPVAGDPLDLQAWDDPAQEGPNLYGPDPAKGR